jgi:hypothetical protein
LDDGDEADERQRYQTRRHIALTVIGCNCEPTRRLATMYSICGRSLGRDLWGANLILLSGPRAVVDSCHAAGRQVRARRPIAGIIGKACPRAVARWVDTIFRLKVMRSLKVRTARLRRSGDARWEMWWRDVRPPSDSKIPKKSPRRISPRGLQSFRDDVAMPVVCPTYQIHLRSIAPG